MPGLIEPKMTPAPVAQSENMGVRWGTEVTQSLARTISSAVGSSWLLLKGVVQFPWNPKRSVQNISYAILLLKHAVFYALLFLCSLLRCGIHSEYFDKIRNMKFFDSLKSLLSGDEAFYSPTIGQIWKQIFGICDTSNLDELTEDKEAIEQLKKETSTPTLEEENRVYPRDLDPAQRKRKNETIPFDVPESMEAD